MSDIRADPYSLAPDEPLPDPLTQLAFLNADESFAVLKDDVRLLKEALTRGSDATRQVIQNFVSTMTSTSTALGVPLTIAEGGTSATSASDARTSLGLGTIATQDANAVAITGGSVGASFVVASIQLGAGATASALAFAASDSGIVLQPSGGGGVGILNVQSFVINNVATNALFDCDTYIGGNSTQVIGFYGEPGAARQTITGSAVAGSALKNLLTGLAALGIINDGTT